MLYSKAQGFHTKTVQQVLYRVW